MNTHRWRYGLGLTAIAACSAGVATMFHLDLAAAQVGPLAFLLGYLCAKMDLI